MLDLVIKNGLVVTAEGEFRWDVGVRGGVVVEMGKEVDAPAGRTIDATNKLILPGCIDPHTHMGIPIKDTFSADDFRSGSRASACGGTTTIIDFTVQSAGQTIREALDERLRRAKGKSYVDFGVHVNVTNRPDANIALIPGLVDEGFRSFKLFSTYREAGMMVTWPAFRRVVGQVARSGGIALLHAEDNGIVERETARQISAGHKAAIYHARSRPAGAEAKAIETAGQIAGELGAKLYIVHVSSAAGLEAGLKARAQGVDIYLETCPHYLVLTEAAYERKNGHYAIATPPLRTQADCDALWQAVADGGIDAIGTDHCPFTTAQKNTWGGQFQFVPNGIAGVENRLPLLYTYGVAEGRISLSRMVELLAENPAGIFNLATKGQIEVGRDADLVIYDPQGEDIIRASDMHSATDWSVYEGMKVVGRVDMTILRGEVLVEEGEFVGVHPAGRCLAISNN